MNTPLRLLSLLLCVMTLLCVFAPAAVFAADNAPISELALSQGDEGMMTLEKNGYTVMGRPLTGDYWLGYKRGGSAVTGLVVSSDNSNSVTVNGIAYQRVGSLGGAGSLYLTRDAGAGSAVFVDSSAKQRGICRSALLRAEKRRHGPDAPRQRRALQSRER